MMVISMNEENQVSYYAIIPATIRYNKDLKPAEKLLYGEITALANKNGFCYAKNRYFADLYNVTIHTVSQWISHLEKLGFLMIELIKNSKNQITERKIYIKDTPYVQKNTYPYVLIDTYPMYKKVQYNNIKYNNIDFIFNLIIEKSNQVPIDFYKILNQLEFLYTKEILSIMQEDKTQMIKNIIYILYDIFMSPFNYILNNVDRQTILNLYLIAKDYSPDDLIAYCKKSIINKYTNGNV